MSTPLSVPVSAIRALLLDWVSQQLTPAALDWVLQKEHLLNEGHSNLDFYLTLGTVPRHTGKGAVNLTSDQIIQAQALIPGWQPQYDRVDQLVRILFLLELPTLHLDTYKQIVQLLFTTAETGELVAFCRALPLLSYPKTVLLPLATEALRHNVLDVFKAVACNNPFPYQYFDDAAFNQMVLKAAFNNIDLNSIYRLNHRSNEALQDMMTDFVAERRAAGRSVAPSWLELSTGCLAY